MDSETRFLRRGRALARRGRAGRWRRPLLSLGALLLGTIGLLRFLGGSLFAVQRFEISGNGRVFLAKEGDTVTDRDVVFTVGKISADGAELTDARDGSTRRLTLK